MDPIDRIEAKIDKILEQIGNSRERIVKLETNQKTFMSIIAGLWGVCMLGLGVVFHRLH